MCFVVLIQEINIWYLWSLYYHCRDLSRLFKTIESLTKEQCSINLEPNRLQSKICKMCKVSPKKAQTAVTNVFTSFTRIKKTQHFLSHNFDICCMGFYKHLILSYISWLCQELQLANTFSIWSSESAQSRHIMTIHLNTCMYTYTYTCTCTGTYLRAHVHVAWSRITP